MDTPAAPNPPVDLPAPPAPPAELPYERGRLILIFGVVLPAITIVVELLTRMCAEAFFDPLPTLGHVFLAAAVPVTNALAVLTTLRRREGRRLEAIVFAQAAALAVAAFYTLTFLPLLPVGLFGLVFFGLGILPLTPLLTLLASVRTLRALLRLRKALGGSRRRTVWAGLAAGAAVLVALQIPTAATRVLMAMAASDDPATSRSGLRWLRRLGERDLLLRACYERPTGATDLLSAVVHLTAPVPATKVREIYYRVTGVPFETEAAPRLGRRGDRSEREWDEGQGGTEVGVVPLRGLSLASSRMDGSIDGRAALAYLEWTFELRNDGVRPREARAEVVLPPGGVVSRVTLWIDGEEREAAFAGRDVTRRAYQKVVQTRRDPILVTTTAPGRILVQCFPVLPDGGVMKARIGITAPLRLGGRTAGTLGLPYIVQRNFEVPSKVAHAVWVASKEPFAAPPAPLARERLAAGGEEIRGALPEPVAPGPLASLTVQRPGDLVSAWTEDRAAGKPTTPPALIRQTLRSEPIPAPARLVVVIDGSAAMAASAAGLQAALRGLPKTLPVAIVLAGDEPRALTAGGVAPLSDQARAALRLDGGDYFQGGIDSLPALLAAWDRAAAVPGGAVLWIHGPQPLLLAPAEALRQRIERRPGGPVIHTYAAVGGENRLLARLADLPALQAVPRLSAGQAELTEFLASADGAHQRLVAVRERQVRAGATKAAAPPEGVETSDHLARLWAHDRIDALARGRAGAPASAADRQEALALASRYHLVTPVSGAVVLETKAQYRDAGLNPAEPGQVPTVPEPETWALLALVAAVLVMAVIGRRRRLAGGRLAA